MLSKRWFEIRALPKEFWCSTCFSLPQIDIHRASAARGPQSEAYGVSARLQWQASKVRSPMKHLESWDEQEHTERLNLKSLSATWKIFAENLEQFQFLGHWSHVWDTEVFCFDYFLTCIGVRKTRRSIMFKYIRMIKQLGLEQRMLAETPQPNTFVYTVD